MIVEPQFGEEKIAGFKKFQKSVTKDGELSTKELLDNNWERSTYEPSEDEKKMRTRIILDFMNGMTNMWTPRVEFNDLSVIQRLQVDQMSFNTYQANNGNPPTADVIQAWRSNALRPIVRNQCISTAAHVTARTIFPKVFAYNEDSDEERDAAQVMEDLMEWSGDQSDYKMYALRRVISALSDPISIGYEEYAETYRRVKRRQPNGKYIWETMLDPELSGFQNHPVSVDEFYIENFYEPNIQNQGFLIWRRVIPYSLAKAKYGALYDNFDKYVKPGVQTTYSDANQAFYYVYDPNMRQFDVEEIMYWNKALDVKIIMVNGVMLTPFDNPNPRNDKLYPFDGFGYELINNRCFYYKSLAFKLMQDANIINTLYPMMIDKKYLQLMPPMVNIGSDMISSNVIVPGSITTLRDPNSSLKALQISPSDSSDFQMMQMVEKSINESGQPDTLNGQPGAGLSPTAYQISQEVQSANTILGLFIQMISQHVKDYGKLLMGDIIQFMTIPDVTRITANAPLVYKTFLLHDKQSSKGSSTRKIKFTNNLPEGPWDSDTQLKQSYETMKNQGGSDSKTELYEVNPVLFRNLNYFVTISPDILNPRSDDLARAYSLETYDRAINNPILNQEEVARSFLLRSDPVARKDPDKYIAKQQPAMNPGNSPQNTQQAMLKPKPITPGTASGLPTGMPTAPSA